MRGIVGPAADLGGTIIDHAPLEPRCELQREDRCDALRHLLADARQPERAEWGVLTPRIRPPEEAVRVEHLWIGKHRRVLVTFPHAHAHEPVARDAEPVELQLRSGAPVSALALLEPQRLLDDARREIARALEG